MAGRPTPRWSRPRLAAKPLAYLHSPVRGSFSGGLTLDRWAAELIVGLPF